MIGYFLVMGLLLILLGAFMAYHLRPWSHDGFLRNVICAVPINAGAISCMLAILFWMVGK